MSGRPGALRVALLLLRLGFRRWINRFGVIFRLRKKKPDPSAPRQATPGKSRTSWIFPAFIGVFMLYNSVNLSSQFLRKVSDRADRGPVAQVAVHPALWPILENAGKDSAGLRAALEARRDKAHRSPTPESDTRIEEVVRTFEKHGLDGFRKDRHLLPPLSRDLWPLPGRQGAAAAALGLLLLMLGLSQALITLGTGNQDLGRLEWSLEWLFTFPVPARTLFCAKVAEYACVNGYGWFITFPLLLTACWVSGLGPGSIPAAAAATLFLGVILASIRISAETWLRKTFTFDALKNFQAAFTLLGTLLLFTVFGLALTPSIPEAALEFGVSFPAAALWNPFSLPALLVTGQAPAACAGMLLLAALFPLLSTGLASRLVRDGLIVSSGVYAGTRGRPVHVPRGPFRGILGKELRLLFRDKNFLVQTLVIPLIVFAFNVLANPNLVAGVTGDVRHAAVLAFSVGAYVLMFSAYHVLTVEGHTLWLLYTFPRDLHGILLRKTSLWCGFATLYAALVFVVVSLAGRGWSWDGVDEAAVALVGVVLYSFVAAALGVLGIDPQEAEIHRRMKPELHYLYMLLSGLYAFTIYTPMAWGRIVQIVLSGLLVLALWQKVRDRLPYLLDPTEAPPPRVALSDGLIAVLAFFVIQGIVIVLLQDSSVPPGALLVLAYLVSGGLVGFFSLYVLWRQKVPDLLREVGLRSGRSGLGASAMTGLVAGVAAAAVGLLYLKATEWIPLLHGVRDELQRISAERRLASGPWLAVLAVAAAPLFEEFLFRGLLFTGLRRSVPPALAILASAAIFAIIHPPVSAVPVFFAGLAAAWVFERTRFLLAPILAHAVYNAAMLFLG